MAEKKLRRPQDPTPDFKALLAHLKQRDAERDEKNEAQLGEVLGLVVRRLYAVDGALETMKKDVAAVQAENAASKTERASLLARLDEAISWQGEARDLVRITAEQIKDRVDDSAAETAKATKETAATLATATPQKIATTFLSTWPGRIVGAGAVFAGMGAILDILPRLARGWDAFWRWVLAAGVQPPGG